MSLKVLLKTLLQLSKKCFLPFSLHLPTGDGCPHNSRGTMKQNKSSVIWVETVKSWHKTTFKNSLTEQPTSFQISFGTSAPAMEITRGEVKAMPHSLSVLRLGEDKGKRGLSIPHWRTGQLADAFTLLWL